jgi:16S rRNA (guanine1207-N2)-methyltransferase
VDFSPTGDIDVPRTVVTLDMRDRVVELEAEPGLFSHRAVDVGTSILIELAPNPPDRGALLDLGCGYGPITVAAALRAPNATIWAVDVDDRALLLTEQNVRRLRLANVVTASPRAVPPDIAFAAIYSNPPTRIGKHALRALMAYWLARLERRGRAYLVIKQSAGADGMAHWLSEAGFPVRRYAAKRGYRLLEVRPARRVPT